jgi:LmbE family N-acetylglucosaminyl deacetylase
MDENGAAAPLPRDGTLGIPAPRSASELQGAGHPMPRLDPQIEILRDWPRRTALVVGDSPDPQIPAVLHKFGFATAVTNLAQARSAARALGIFTFLVLSADSLASDEAVPMIRELHGLSPSSRLLLERPTGALDSDVLLRALRAGVADVVHVSGGAFHQAIATGLRQAGALRERVLAIGAHPDDVEIGCAGTLLDHRLRGDRVSVLTLSRGAVGGDTRVRVEESKATAEAIGAQLLCADLPDSRIEDGITTIRMIETAVSAVDPTVIYVHSLHDNHQDHRAVAMATASATRGVRRVFAFQSPSATNDFKPTQFVPIDSVLQRKVQVLRMFASQKDRNYLDPELVVAGAKYWARHLGADARYAEPFEVIRSMGDLRQHAGIPTLVSDAQLGFALPSYSGLPPTPDGADLQFDWA